MGVGEILDGGLRVYRQAFWPALGLSALFIAPYIVVVELLVTAKTGDMLMASLFSGGKVAVPPLPAESLAGLEAVAFLVTLLVGPWVYAAHVQIADSTLRGERLGFGKALWGSLRRLWALLITFLLAGVAGTILSIVAFMLISAIMGLGAGLLLKQGVNQEIFSILLALVMFPVMYFVLQSVWISFLYVPQVVMLENRRYFKAIGRSFSLAWQFFLPNSAVLLAATGLVLSLSMITILPEYVWSAVVGEPGLKLVTAAAGGIINMFIFPLMALITTVAYHDRRLRNEGTDLERRIRRLEEESGLA